MKKQELFDTITRHLFTQKVRCEKDGSCVYRGPDGMKCAVGAVIPDEFYDPGMENRTVDGLCVPTIYDEEKEKDVPNPFKVPTYIKRNKYMLAELQSVHDSCLPRVKDHFDTDFFFKRLRNVAVRHNVNQKVLKEVYLGSNS